MESTSHFTITAQLSACAEARPGCRKIHNIIYIRIIHNTAPFLAYYRTLGFDAYALRYS